MLQSFIYAVFLLLVLTGLFFLAYIFINRMLYKTGNNDFYTVILGKSDDFDLPDKVYSAFLQANTLNFSHRNPVFVVDCGISDDIKRQCELSIFPNDSIIYLHGESIVSEDEYIVIRLDKE